MRRTVLLALVASMLAPSAVSAAGDKSDAAHRSGICGEVRKLDLLLYDEPHGHVPTATCSYTDERLLIRPRAALSDERLKRFVFLAFVVAGKLRNDDFMMPPRVYAGYGDQCQWLTIDQAALLQRDAKFGGDSGMLRSYMVASGAPHSPCPK